MIKKYFKLDRKNIVFVQFIIEGYGDMATVKTVDPQAAIIQVSIIPDFISDMHDLIEHLKDKYKMTETCLRENG
ncbi:MAG TPA: DUF4911 domain-containing protein [Smithella sp.]|nr:DUF4911 domain-containing protein [Smithella sp.]